uniref:Uncharacterized protein n=1 Tax=Arundo donax TaxID=35708 RepID=A0A0A8ZTH0_ARUDO
MQGYLLHFNCKKGLLFILIAPKCFRHHQTITIQHTPSDPKCMF